MRNFFEDNGLQINASKTSITEHMTRQKRTRMDGIPTDLTVTDYTKNKKNELTQVENLITDKDKYRYLGLNFQNNGNWEAHVMTGKKPLLQTLRRQLGMITKIGKLTTSRIRLQIVNTLILSRINYMICIWGNSTDTLTYKIQVLLNKASRFINNSNKFTKTSKLMENCNWLSVKEMTKYFSLLQMWKTEKMNVPLYLKDKIRTLDDGKLSTDLPRLQITSRSYRWTTVNSWNKLPENLRLEKSLKTFKKGVKRWIKEQRQPDPGLDDTDAEDRPTGQ